MFIVYQVMLNGFFILSLGVCFCIVSLVVGVLDVVFLSDLFVM